MYVAMTRAKKEVHLFSGNGFYSQSLLKNLKKNLDLLIQKIPQDIQVRIIFQNFFALHTKWD